MGRSKAERKANPRVLYKTDRSCVSDKVTVGSAKTSSLYTYTAILLSALTGGESALVEVAEAVVDGFDAPVGGASHITLWPERLAARVLALQHLGTLQHLLRMLALAVECLRVRSRELHRGLKEHG